MAALQIKWNQGDGYIYLSQSEGEGDATILISSDVNNGGSRSQEITFTIIDKDGNEKKKVLTVHQEGDSSLGYDGHWASTPDADYSRTINCETANSEYVDGVDTLVNGGSSQI